MADRAYSLSWNEKANQWIARFRQADGLGGWGTKRIPKDIRRHQKLDAERWMISWYGEHMRTGGLNSPASQVRPAVKTIRLLAERWLRFREEDDGTAWNTFAGLRHCVRNWILTNARFEHFPIDELDVECEFTPGVCCQWIKSLRGAPRTRLQYAQCLRQFIKDCIMLEWLNPQMANPLDQLLVVRELKQLREAAEDDETTTFLTPEQAATLLCEPNRKVIDFRRLRYLVALATGMRDHEIQGLIWKDFILDAALPHVFVQRQLVKGGPLPFVHVRDFKRLGIKKTQIGTLQVAVVSDPKRKSRRFLPLHPLLVRGLHYWWTTGWKQYTRRSPREDDPVFPSGERNSHQAYGQFCFSESPELLRRDMERLGLPTEFIDPKLPEPEPFVFHSLRHTFATHLELAGAERSRTSEMLGHKSKDVASKDYIGELIVPRARLIAQLPLPNRVQLQGKLIEVPDPVENVVPLKRSKKSRVGGV